MTHLKKVYDGNGHLVLFGKTLILVKSLWECQLASTLDFLWLELCDYAGEYH